MVYNVCEWGNFTTADVTIDIHQCDTEEAGVLAIWLKGVCLAVASQNPGDVHAALLGHSFRKGCINKEKRVTLCYVVKEVGYLQSRGSGQLFLSTWWQCENAWPVGTTRSSN